jgi:hypothetical protein
MLVNFIMTSIFDNILSATERRYMKHVGINRLLKYNPKFTSLELKYYTMLQAMEIFYIPQYEMNGRYYDAYLPDHNVLLEFDGTFWHPLKEEECKYGFQKKSMKVDKLKNYMAEKKGIKIVRIREESPVTKEQLKKLIWD